MRLCAALVLLLATTSACTQEADVSRDPGVIAVIAGPSAVNLNPYSNVLSSRQVGTLLFRGMFGVDGSGMPVPDLATEVPTVENGGMSADRREITYHLDERAEWADGEALTADDVVFTWGLIESGALIDDPRGYDNVADVVAVDPATVRLTLYEPDATFAWRFVPYVLPRHLLAESVDILSDDFWYRPVGSRGRVVDRYLKSTQADLVDPEGNAPTIRVVFAETHDAARTVWESQEHAVWLQPPLGPVGAEKSDVVPSFRWSAFVMNPSEGRVSSELSVRQAFSDAATVTVSPGDPGPFGLPLSDWTMGSEGAANALGTSGWRRGSDGTRVKGGRPLVFNIIFNPLDAAEGERVENIPVGERFGGRIEVFPTYQYTDFTGASPLVLGAFDIALTEFPIGVPLGWAWPFDSADVPSEDDPAGLNVARVRDPLLDDAYRSMRNAGSPAELTAALSVAWERLEQQRYIHWDARLERSLLYKGVEGVTAQPVEEYALRFADEWRLPERAAGE